MSRWAMLGTLALLAVTMAVTIAFTVDVLLNWARWSETLTTPWILPAGCVLAFFGEAALGVWLVTLFGTIKLAVSVEDSLRTSTDRFRSIETLLEVQGNAINKLVDLNTLSDQAKSLLYRNRELEALREAVQEDVMRQDYASAEGLIDSMESRLGFAAEAKRLEAENKAREAETQRLALEQKLKEEAAKALALAQEAEAKRLEAEKKAKEEEAKALAAVKAAEAIRLAAEQKAKEEEARLQAAAMRSTVLKRPSLVWIAPLRQRRQRELLRSATVRSWPGSPNGFPAAASSADSGHPLTQAPQSSQIRGLKGLSASRSASLTSMAKRWRGPNSGVRNILE